MKLAVIVGRFQVDILTEGHKKLINEAFAYDKVLIVIGESPLRNTRRNPLAPREVVSAIRRYLVVDPSLLIKNHSKTTIETLMDCASDDAWSKNLDGLIERHLISGMTPILIGGRDSFLDHYRGKYEVTIVKEFNGESGTVRRKALGCSISITPEFRHGVIWASQNRYLVVYSTVDIIPIDRINNKVLIGRKNGEKAWGFIGGFLDPQDKDLASAAQRELREEAALDVPYAQLVYVASCKIEDWRYGSDNNDDTVMTHIFTCDVSSNENVEAQDDIEEVRWVSLDDKDYPLKHSHQQIWAIFNEWNVQNG